MAEKHHSRGFGFLKNWYGHWWMMALQGLLLAIVGAVCFFRTGETLRFVVWLIGIELIIVGAMYVLLFFADPIIGAFGMGRAVTDLVIGLVLVTTPGFVVGFFVALIGIFAIIAGIGILSMHDERGGIWQFLRVVVSILLIIFGVMAFVRPGAFVSLFVRILAVVLMIVGVYMIASAFSFRKELKEIEKDRKGFTDYKVE